MSLALIAAALVAFQQPQVLFEDVTLVPLDRDRTLEHRSVLVRDGRIAAIGEAGKVAGDSATLRIDGRGKFLLPGLADMHVHLFNSRDLLLYVAHGVTTVRNLGGYAASDSILEIRREVAEGERLGPTIFTSGNWLDGDPPYRPINTVLRTPEEARAEVERQARAGFDFIKVYATLTPEVYQAILDAARKHRIPVTGHVPLPVGLDRVLAGKQVAIDHAAALAGDPKRLAELLDRSDVALTTTLVMLRLSLSMRGAPERVEELLARPEARLVSPGTRQFWRRAPFTGLPKTEAVAAIYPETEALVLAMQRKGVPLLLGTDGGLWGNVPGVSALEEVELLVKSGLTPYEALRAAVVAPAKFLNRHVRDARQPGALESGNRADLLLLEGNPLEDVGELRRRVGVMLRGRWLPAAELERQLAALAAEYAAQPAADSLP